MGKGKEGQKGGRKGKKEKEGEKEKGEEGMRGKTPPSLETIRHRPCSKRFQLRATKRRMETSCLPSGTCHERCGTTNTSGQYANVSLVC